MKGRYPQATDSGKTSSKTIARRRDMTQIVGLFMAPLRTLVPPLFGLHDGEPRDKNDSVQAQTATCERLMQWEFLSSSGSGRHHFVEKYRWSHRRPRHKCADANRHKKCRRHRRDSGVLPLPSRLYVENTKFCRFSKPHKQPMMRLVERHWKISRSACGRP